MTTLIIFTAQYLPWAIAVASCIWIAWNYRTRGAVLFVLTVVSALAAGKGLGLLWFDPLPFVVNGTTPLFPHEANNGFPSDHTILAAAAAAAVFAYRRLLGLIMFMLAFGVGAARVAAGVHHWVDILAALVVAAICAVLVRWAMRRYYPAVS